MGAVLCGVPWKSCSKGNISERSESLAIVQCVLSPTDVFTRLPTADLEVGSQGGSAGHLPAGVCAMQAQLPLALTVASRRTAGRGEVSPVDIREEH